MERDEPPKKRRRTARTPFGRRAGAAPASQSEREGNAPNTAKNTARGDLFRCPWAGCDYNGPRKSVEAHVRGAHLRGKTRNATETSGEGVSSNDTLPMAAEDVELEAIGARSERRARAIASQSHEISATRRLQNLLQNGGEDSRVRELERQIEERDRAKFLADLKSEILSLVPRSSEPSKPDSDLIQLLLKQNNDVTNRLATLEQERLIGAISGRFGDLEDRLDKLVEARTPKKTLADLDVSREEGRIDGESEARAILFRTIDRRLAETGALQRLSKEVVSRPEVVKRIIATIDDLTLSPDEAARMHEARSSTPLSPTTDEIEALLRRKNASLRSEAEAAPERPRMITPSMPEGETYDGNQP